MVKLCIFTGTMLGSYAGWYLGQALTSGYGWPFTLSGAGSLLGVWLGWKIGRKFD